MIHDQYYSQLPDCVELAKQLDLYIAHIEDCLTESGIREDCKLEMEASLYTVKAVRADVKRIYEE